MMCPKKRLTKSACDSTFFYYIAGLLNVRLKIRFPKKVRANPFCLHKDYENLLESATYSFFMAAQTSKAELQCFERD